MFVYECYGSTTLLKTDTIPTKPHPTHNMFIDRVQISARYLLLQPLAFQRSLENKKRVNNIIVVS